MVGIRALWEATLDMWEELFSIFVYSIAGAVLSLLLIPIPFVLAGHYGVARRIVHMKVVSWRDWYENGREHWRFFYKWGALLGFSIVLIFIDVRFYGRATVPFAEIFQQVLVGVFLLWMAIQPFVPAFYFEQEDKSLRVALRNGAVIAFTDPVSTVAMWLVTLLLTGLVYFLGLWPVLAAIPFFVALTAMHIVNARLKEYRQDDSTDGKKRGSR